MTRVGGLFGAIAAIASVAVSTAASAGSRADVTSGPGCTASDGALAVSRVVEIDTSAGPLFGDITAQVKEDSFLGPKEVVLTFDDGPMPWVTSSILETLDKYCTKATFFAVGKMAVAYPSTLRKIVQRGHSLGGHTWSHPLNLKRLSHDKAMAEIEKGMAAVALASGGQAAPFFRFPGLSDNAKMLSDLQARGIASFTVDVVSDDSYISNPAKLVSTTLSRVEARRGGILLFHDIKPATAKALPTILSELKKRGYKVVHMRSKSNVKPLAQFEAELQPVLAKKDPPQGTAVAKAAMLPFFGATGPEKREAAESAPPTETIAPEPRDRSGKPAAAPGADGGRKAATTPPPPGRAAGVEKSKATKNTVLREPIGDAVTLRGYPVGDNWSARVRRERLSRPIYD